MSGSRELSSKSVIVSRHSAQVSCAAREGLAAFRETLPPLRWLALRGLMLERFCSIAEGLPALARAADEK